MNLRFLEYSHTMVKNGKTIEDDNLPTEVININEEHKYSYFFITSDSYFINFSASCDLGQTQVNNFHLELSKVEKLINLSVDEFLIYEKEMKNSFFMSHGSPLDDFDLHYLKELLTDNHNAETADKLLAYHNQKENNLNGVENFVYPICSKDDLNSLFNFIKTLHLVPYDNYDILFPEAIDQELRSLIIEQNIIKNSNSLIAFDNHRNDSKAFDLYLEELQDIEFENDTTLEDTIKQMEYDNLSLSEKI
jgi:hypothetical protein